MKNILTTFCFAFCIGLAASAQNKTENIFIITWDGFRWQELFTGADANLIEDKEYVHHPEELKKRFWSNNAEERRKKLLPFIWSDIAKMGQIYGNRDKGSFVNLTNPYWFSYPGYSEILVGYVDKSIDSNNKFNNPNKTVLEILNETPKYKGKVAAFGSWDVFPYIINEERSGIPVNAGFENAKGSDLTGMEKSLNTIQSQLPKIWATVRYDAFTHHYAKEHLKKHHPNIVYISYGETDDFAHDGEYGAYLRSAWQTDQFLKDLWEFVQSDPHYKDKTTFVITTDHGRGTVPKETWKHHGDKINGADETWLMVYGPDTKPKGEVSNSKPIKMDQIAATAAGFLKFDYKNTKPVGAPISDVLK
ncbi:phosphoglyceromutase [Fulvivirgaceae bacterium BMA10]|uniref:Phosphoglyceromutase n=1 Tax=Splendidivirga corallicola TaxID=3051826 RepID=A0ABT8KK39_9BACT|nr:phosphoglyceromutase [Fulvivirgaceae bacterium BMA10]